MTSDNKPVSPQAAECPKSSTISSDPLSPGDTTFLKPRRFVISSRSSRLRVRHSALFQTVSASLVLVPPSAFIRPIRGSGSSPASALLGPPPLCLRALCVTFLAFRTSVFAFNFLLSAFAFPFLIPPAFLRKYAKTLDIPPRSSKRKKIFRLFQTVSASFKLLRKNIRHSPFIIHVMPQSSVQFSNAANVVPSPSGGERVRVRGERRPRLRHYSFTAYLLDLTRSNT